MSLPRQVLYSIIGLRDAMRQQGMSAPVALVFPQETYDKLLGHMAACRGLSVEAARVVAEVHGFSFCGVRIDKEG